MKKLFLALFLLLSISLHASVSSAVLKKRMLSDLDFIRSTFEVKYAPLAWKWEYSKWDLDTAIDEAKGKIEALQKPTIKDFQRVVKDFFNSTRDYHVGCLFFSTENAKLPFTVKGSDGRIFIAHVDHDILPPYRFPVEAGDELIRFDGLPINKALEKIRLREFGHNRLETDQALAELCLTHRRGCKGELVPKGDIKIVVCKKGTGEKKTLRLSWDYENEEIHDLAYSSPKVECAAPFSWSHHKTPFLPEKELLFKKMMTAPFWQKEATENCHGLGARESFLPPLGRVVYRSEYENHFDAYIFENEDEKRIGFVRIAHYHGDEEEARAFGELITKFEAETDALVIDQLNNPGGSVFYLYALLSRLTDHPLATPHHHIKLTQEELLLAVEWLPSLSEVSDDEGARACLGETIGGYHVNLEVARLFKLYCEFLIDAWNRGDLYTEANYLIGVDEIHPHPKTTYTKPILVLINHLDFSAGDFFPAILQDNQRATLLGTRTAGAGGYVSGSHFHNTTGIRGFQFSASLAERLDQRPIENLGVEPDVCVPFTAHDLQYNYVDYVTQILETLNGMLK